MHLAPKTLRDYLVLPNLPKATPLRLSHVQLTNILTTAWRHRDVKLQAALYEHANDITTRFFGNKVYYRGLIEFSNICENKCSYCGINKDATVKTRYLMPIREVLEVANWAEANNIQNIMLQSGEVRTPARIKYLEALIRAIRQETSLTISLSVGELAEYDYQRLYDAGARRYLIRIETSNPDLYAKLHPEPMSWHKRVECLKTLQSIGYMLGTGIMVGLPGQTLEDLANDILFFNKIGANMIGMGPYIPQPNTPAAGMWKEINPMTDKKSYLRAMFELTTLMNALTRITLANANISATTALQAIEPRGREIALQRGANVVMPILTPTKYREAYQLYEGKPCITDTAAQCQGCLGKRLVSVEKQEASNEVGDPLNFYESITPLDVTTQTLF